MKLVPAGKLKTAEQMERHFKGMANHHRINILFLVAEQKGLGVDDIAKALNVNFKTISGHTRYLVHSGLVSKRYSGRRMAHSLSPYGEVLVRFIRDFQKIGRS